MTRCEKNNDVSVSAKTRLTSISTPQKPIKKCQKVIKNDQKPAKNSKKRQVFALPILTFGGKNPSGAIKNAVFGPPKSHFDAQIDVSVFAKTRLTFTPTPGPGGGVVYSRFCRVSPIRRGRTIALFLRSWDG
jgi:hypothetical protein